MLVEINLLPTKESKNRTLLLLLVGFGLLLLLGVCSAYLIGQTYEKKISNINKQITQKKELISMEQQKIVNVEDSSSVVQLENAIKWADEYKIKTVPILQHLTGLLPERGFILTFSYSESGAVQLSVQFDTSREAAYYLKALTDSKWVNEVKLNSLSTTDPENQETAETSNELNANDNPRYTGEFTITLNKDSIHSEENANKDGTSSSIEQGGKG